ncbi:MAG TPA: DUF1631 family protein [Ramlibacter sp.]|jgi:hypothetical protein|uniref:DUF1631 family protein n=1 Tax=Ramlibacter sp. TaxID=1917967 RepID=UPI002D67F1AA|nr:DUF1631 family protein [Ramlibacter sp.]HZY17246.1 DUF1631 family protein [Ramlibacter sp.]
MAALPNIVLPCINEAVARSRRMVERAVDEAVQALDQEALQRTSGRERRELQDAARALSAARNSWCTRFPPALRAALESPPQRPSTPVTVRPGSLTLVGDAELMESIETARLEQQLAPLVEQPLEELDTLMSAALRLEGVQPERNPLRVAIFTAALRGLMNQPAPIEPGWPALWIRHMAEPLSHDLIQIYRAATRLLRQAGVQAASYRVVTGPAPLERSSRAAEMPRVSQPMPLTSGRAPLASGRAPLQPPGGPGAQPSGFAGWIGRVMEAVRGPLLHDFLGAGTPQLPVHQPLDASWYAGVDRELAELEAGADGEALDASAVRAHEHLPPVDRPMRQVGTDSPLNMAVWGPMGAPRQRSLVRTRLKKQARQVGQVVGLEVVHQLVDEVARDPRLLAPVREAIVALEPALARLALHAPQFFGQAQHPARRLVERVAERSFRYNDEFAEAFGDFFQPVQAGFRALNQQDDFEDAKAFGEVLAQLEADWAQQDELEATQQEDVLGAVRFAERRQATAEQIAWELSHRSDLEGVPAIVQEFLYDQWSLVIAHARLSAREGELDPHGYIAVVTDLLWSVKREATLRDPARAFELIPLLVGRIRDGLALIGQTPQQSSIFGALEQLHRPVLKLRAKHRRQSLTLPEPEREGDERLQPTSPRKPAPTESVWLAPEEQQACGFLDHPLQEGPGAPAQPDQAGADDALSDTEAESLISTLREGGWVDLQSGDRWRRARLVWSGANGALFMFVSEGGEPHSMTRRSLHRLVVNRHLRPVQAHEVVQHAIDALSRAQPQAIAA